MADLYYIEEGYYDIGYYVYIANAVSAVSSTINSSCQAEKITSAQSSVSIQTSIFAAISHIEGVDLFAFTNASLSAQIDRFRDNDSQQSAAFTNSVSADRTRLSTGDFVSSVSLLIDFVKLKSAQADLLDNIFITCEGTRIQSVYIEGNADINAQGSVSAQANKITDIVSTINCEFNQTAAITHLEGTDMFAFTEAQIAAQLDRIRFNNIIATDVFNVATDFVRFRNAQADANDVFSANIDAQRSRDTNIETQAAFSFAVISEKISNTSSNQNSVFTINCQADRIRENFSDLSFVVTTFVDNLRIRYSDATTSSVASVNVNAIVVKDAHLTSFGAVTLNCQPVKSVQSSSTQTIAFTQTAIIGKRQRTTALLPVYGNLFASRKIGPNAPQTLTGTFDSINLVNAANRTSNLTQLNSDNWFYETLVSVYSSTGNTQSMDSKVIFNIPMGTRNGVASYFRGELRYRPSEGFTLYVYFLIGGNAGNIPLTATRAFGVGTIFSARVAVSFTGGQKAALYVNGQRLAVNTNVATSGWTIPKSQTVQFAPSFPFTTNTVVHSSYTDHAWLVLGNYTNNGDTTYTYPDPIQYTENTIFLYNFNGNGQETTNLTQTGTSALSSLFTQVTNSNYFSGFRANMNSTATVGAVIGKLNEINLTAFGNAQLNTTVGVIKQHSSAISSEVNLTAANGRLRNNQISAVSQFTLVSNVERLRDNVSNLNSNSQISATVLRIKSLEASVNSQFTLNAIIGKQQGIDLLAFSNASVNTNAVVLRSAAATISSQTSIAADNSRLRNNNIVSNANFSTSITNIRLRYFETNIQNSSSQTSVITLFKGYSVELFARFYTNKPYVEDTYVDEGYATNFLTIANYIVDNLHQLSSVSAMLVDGDIVAQGAALLANGGTLIADVSKITSTSSIQLSNTNTNIDVVKITGIISNIQSSFTVLANIGTSEEVFLTAFTDAALTATVKKNVSIALSLNNAVILYANTADSLNIRGQAFINSVSTQSTNGNRIRFGNANITALAFELTDGDLTARGDISCAVVSNVNITVEVIRATSSNISSTTSTSVQGSRIRFGVITISGAMNFVSEVRDLRLEEIEYRIPGEGWEYRIVGENREYDIIGETRLRDIVSESRIRRIDGETRIYIVEK